jgi:hypothetical protein
VALTRQQVMQQFVIGQLLHDIVRDCFGCCLKEVVDSDHRSLAALPLSWRFQHPPRVPR